MAELTPEQETRAMYDELLGGRMPTPSDALKAARDAVEALPSHLFDRAHTDEIAENLAPDFDRFAAQRGAVTSYCADAQHDVMPLRPIAQTGGGDAGERARAEELINELLDYCPSRLPGPNHELDIERVVFFLRSSRREGAEAMREPGYVIVPREPTEAMIDAYVATGDAKRPMEDVCRERWRAMLAAALRALPIPGSKTDAG